MRADAARLVFGYGKKEMAGMLQPAMILSLLQKQKAMIGNWHDRSKWTAPRRPRLAIPPTKIQQERVMTIRPIVAKIRSTPSGKGPAERFTGAVCAHHFSKRPIRRSSDVSVTAALKSPAPIIALLRLHRQMSIPETTSVESLERYVGGKCLFESRGEAWRDIKAWIIALAPVGDTRHLPSVSEPFLAWTMSGEIDFQERENKLPWITHRIKKGAFFLTSGGAPYDVRWKAMTPEPFEVMFVFVELPLLQRALEEVFGADAAQARLRDGSAFTDGALDSLMERLRDELTRQQASPLFVQGIAQAIAIHLARDYGVTTDESRGSRSLPGYKLRQITDWMAEHAAEDFSLDRIAAQAGLSKFHFQRLFKSATGVTPSRYHINLRMNLARRLLRETKKSVVDIALEVGYANPSHFAQLFRRETGLSPSDYRRQR